VRIVKKILLGSLEIDSDEGKIWLNDLTRCVLRVCGLDFRNKSEKFGMIDVTKNEVVMLDDSEVPLAENELNKKIEEIVQLLILQTFQNFKLSKKKEFLDTVYKMINEI